MLLMKQKYYRLSSGLFEDEDKATTVYCQARLPEISEEATGRGEESDEWSDTESDDVSGGDFGSSDGAPTKSALTSYSMTSSVLPRNEKLTLLDDMFEKVILPSSYFLLYCLDCSQLFKHCCQKHQKRILTTHY